MLANDYGLPILQQISLQSIQKVIYTAMLHHITLFYIAHLLRYHSSEQMTMGNAHPADLFLIHPKGYIHCNAASH